LRRSELSRPRGPPSGPRSGNPSHAAPAVTARDRKSVQCGRRVVPVGAALTPGLGLGSLVFAIYSHVHCCSEMPEPWRDRIITRQVCNGVEEYETTDHECYCPRSGLAHYFGRGARKGNWTLSNRHESGACPKYFPTRYRFGSGLAAY